METVISEPLGWRMDTGLMVYSGSMGAKSLGVGCVCVLVGSVGLPF